MRLAVVPVYNEEDTLVNVLNQLQHLPLDEILLVLNGCTDRSLFIAKLYQSIIRKKLLCFAPPLGVDVPRAIGIKYAKIQKARAVLFVDSDLTDSIESALYALLNDVCTYHTDLALVNCYPYPDYRSPLAQEILSYREGLNRKLNIFHKIGLANPTHGPHCVSQKLIAQIPTYAFAIPPLELSMAVQKQLQIKVSAALQESDWHNKKRDVRHNVAIAETIIGDCMTAINYYTNQTFDRGGFYGYHTTRRFDLLEQFMQ